MPRTFALESLMHARFLLAASTTFASLLLVSGCGSSGNGSTPQDSGAPVVDSGMMMMQEGGAMDSAAPEASVQDSGAPETGMAMTCPVSDGGFPAGYPAMHAPFPVVGYGGGGILAQPEVVTITFQGDAFAPQFEQFGDQILQTCWWDAVRQGYCDTSNNCIGRGVVPATPHVELPMPAAASYTDQALRSFIQSEVASGAFPPPAPGTIYAMYFPGSTVITSGAGTSCDNFDGYHEAVTVTPQGGTPTTVTYAVIDECPGGGTSLLDQTTITASHEFTEASTDPFASMGNYGYTIDYNDSQNLGWEGWSIGGEVGDLCVDILGETQGSPHDVFQATTASGSFTVQRMWSVGAAAAGGDPCLPIGPDDTPYFNLAIAPGAATQIMTVGSQVTFEADAFSTAPLGAWNILSFDWSSYFAGTASAISISFAGEDGGVAPSAMNGDKVMVTLKLNSMPTTQIAQGVNGVVFLLVSQSGNTLHTWPGAVIAQ